MDNGLKSVKMSTAIFIVLTIAVLGFFIAGIGKSTTNQATEGLTISKAEAEGLFANYNNTIVSGTEVQRAITAHEDLCLVKTKKKPTGITLSGAKDASSNNYVNPAARFSAKLEYDSDDNLQHIVFSQVDSSLANDIMDPGLSEPETTPSTETDAPDPTNPLRELIVEQDHDIILLEGAPEPNWKSAGMTVYAVQRNGKKEEVTGYTTNYSSDWRLDEGLAMQVKYMTITYNGIVKNHVPVTLAKSIRDIITISTTSTVAGHPITVDGMNADLKFTVTGMDCTLMDGTGNNFTTQTSSNASGTVHIKVEWPVMGETIEFDVTVSKFEMVVKNVNCPASSGIMVGDQMTYTTNATATFSDTAPYLSNGPAIAQPASGSAISKVGAQAGAVTVTATDTVSGFTVSDTRTVYDAVTLDSPVTVKAGQSYQFTNNTNIQFSPQENLSCTKSGSTYTVTPSKVKVYNVVGKLPDLGNREVSFQLIATNPNWEYTIDNGRATLTKYIGGASSVTITSKVEDPWVSGGVPVVAAVETFSHNTTLQSVQFEPGVQNLKWTFFDCPNLRSVGALPNTVTSMYGTFQKCSGLANVPAIPGSVTEIPYVFAECTSLTVTPHLGDQIRSMYAAFANNPNLTTVTNIPANLTDLAECFSGCTSLRGEIPLIPSSVTKMHGSFYHCDNAVVYIDNSESNVDHGVAFNGVNREVEHYWLWDEWDWQYDGSNIDLIKYKGNQSYVKVPRVFRGRTVVGLQGAFQNNGRITGAIIPATVNNLSYTFSGCSSLVTAPTIPSSARDMSNAFYNCKNLVNPPTIPYGVANMAGTFQECPSLRAAPSIPDTVTSMQQTFQNCRNIPNGPTIGSGVTDMTQTFEGCTSMQQPPTINSTSVELMSSCFSGCTAMVAPPTISHITSLTMLNWTFNNCKTIKTMPTLPGSVKDAGGSFNGCSALNSVQPIPYGCVTIAQAFQGCTSLVNAPDISGTVQNMSYAFNGCTSLVKATAIPDSATDLDHTFSGCVKLAAVPYIGTSVQYMPYTFYDCNSLTSCGWIPANVRGMSHTFENCDNIATTPAINNNWVAWDYTFRDCYKLSAITAFPTGSDNMNGAFFNCWSITSMPTVPNNYTKIYSTFYNCCNVTIYVDNEAPNVYIDGNTFFRVPEYHFLRSEWSYTTGNKYGSATLTGYKGSSRNPKVPRDIGGQVITSMEHTFQGNSNITGADLNNGYLRRMYGTFENCTSLTTMPTIPYGVEEMPTTFQYCSNLTTLTALPSTVRTMNGTFGFCRSLTSAPSIPYGVTTMEHCFRECTSLKASPEIPGTVTSLFWCFEKCTSLTSCGTINDGPTDLQGVFANCTSLVVGTNMPSTAKNLKSAYNGCLNLATMVDAKDSATNMDYMYCNCQNLTSTNKSGGRNIPKTVTSMNHTFEGCYRLRGTIYIAKWLTGYENCFLYCATDANAKLLVNYSAANKDQINAIIATKSSNSKVRKYQQK